MKFWTTINYAAFHSILLYFLIVLYTLSEAYEVSLFNERHVLDIHMPFMK